MRELRDRESQAFAYYSGLAQMVDRLEKDLKRCACTTLNGIPAAAVLSERLRRARLAK